MNAFGFQQVIYVQRSCCLPAMRLSASITCFLVRSPEGQVVSQQLHDQRRILVGVFCNVVKLCNRILKRCAGHLASFIRIIQHLVHEDRVVQGQAKANGMCHQQIFFGHVSRLSICLPCLLGRFALLVTAAELCDVSLNQWKYSELELFSGFVQPKINQNKSTVRDLWPRHDSSQPSFSDRTPAIFWRVKKRFMLVVEWMQQKRHAPDSQLRHDGMIAFFQTSTMKDGWGSKKHAQSTTWCALDSACVAFGMRPWSKSFRMVSQIFCSSFSTLTR